MGLGGWGVDNTSLLAFAGPCFCGYCWQLLVSVGFGWGRGGVGWGGDNTLGVAFFELITFTLSNSCV